jgi:myosin heavy subunit
MTDLKLQGMKIWIPHDEKAWVVGEVNSDNGTVCIVSTKEGRKNIPTKEVAKYETVVSSTLEKVQSDLVHLEAFSEGMHVVEYLCVVLCVVHSSSGAILFQLESRYINNDIYTFVGKILTAINPFKRLDM